MDSQVTAKKEENCLLFRTQDGSVYEVRRAQHRSQLFSEEPRFQALLLSNHLTEEVGPRRFQQFFSAITNDGRERHPDPRPFLRQHRHFTNDVFIDWSIRTSILRYSGFKAIFAYHINQRLHHSHVDENQIDTICNNRPKTFIRCRDERQMIHIIDMFYDGISFQGMLGSAMQAFVYA